MPIREFVDAAGVRWQVWSTVPWTTGVADALRRGWLTFESADERRRLVPIPADWTDATVDRLCDYCRLAVALGRTPTTGVWRIERADPEL